MCRHAETRNGPLAPVVPVLAIYVRLGQNGGNSSASLPLETVAPADVTRVTVVSSARDVAIF